VTLNLEKKKKGYTLFFQQSFFFYKDYCIIKFWYEKQTSSILKFKGTLALFLWTTTFLNIVQDHCDPKKEKYHWLQRQKKWMVQNLFFDIFSLSVQIIKNKNTCSNHETCIFILFFSTKITMFFSSEISIQIFSLYCFEIKLILSCIEKKILYDR